MINGKLAFKKGTSIQTISINDLEAVVVKDYICTLVLPNGKEEHCGESLKEMQTKLRDSFLKINRNTIVNSEKIDSIDNRNREVIMESGRKYKITVRRMKAVKDFLLKP